MSAESQSILDIIDSYLVEYRIADGSHGALTLQYYVFLQGGWGEKRTKHAYVISKLSNRIPQTGVGISWILGRLGD